MNKQTVDINVPDGYEIAEGDQPRLPRSGDYFLSMVDLQSGCAQVDFHNTYCIILKKKLPEYELISVTMQGQVYQGNGKGLLVPSRQYVEKNALRHALELFEAAASYNNLQDPNYLALKAIIDDIDREQLDEN